MAIKERSKTTRGQMRTRLSLSRPMTWNDLVEIATALASSPRVTSFFLSASASEIGAGGACASSKRDLSLFARNAKAMGGGDLEGSLTCDGETADFFFGDTQEVVFLTKANSKIRIAALLASAEHRAMSQ